MIFIQTMPLQGIFTIKRCHEERETIEESCHVVALCQSILTRRLHRTVENERNAKVFRENSLILLSRGNIHGFLHSAPHKIS